MLGTMLMQMHSQAPTAQKFGALVGGLLPCCCVPFAVVIGLLGTALWIWMLIDCIQHETDEGNNKVVWILVIVLTHWVGALIYYFVRYRARPRS